MCASVVEGVEAAKRAFAVLPAADWPEDAKLRRFLATRWWVSRKFQPAYAFVRIVDMRTDVVHPCGDPTLALYKIECLEPDPELHMIRVVETVYYWAKEVDIDNPVLGVRPILPGAKEKDEKAHDNYSLLPVPLPGVPIMKAWRESNITVEGRQRTGPLAFGDLPRELAEYIAMFLVFDHFRDCRRLKVDPDPNPLADVETYVDRFREISGCKPVSDFERFRLNYLKTFIDESNFNDVFNFC